MLSLEPKVTAPDTNGGLIKGTLTAVIAALIMAALYFGREVFVPIALASLLSFALAPLARGLQNWRLPRPVAVVTVVVFAFAIIFAIGGLLATQMTQLASDLPGYESNIRSKIQTLRGTATTNRTLERAADVLTDLGKEINKPKDAPAPLAIPPTGVSRPDAQPIPVEVRQPPPTALESIAALIAPLLHALMTTGIVVIFVIFTLMQRKDLRNRLIRLAGSRDLQKTTIALDDAAQRIGKLLLSQLALNTAFGFTVGTGLWLIGIPSAILWGILAGVLRFVPYIGSFISAVFPLMLGFAVDPGWSLLLWTAALFFVLEPLAGQVIEPLLYGRSTGMSPLAVVLSATFWTTLWGPIGLVLATPLTICLVVIGRHVESLGFLDVLFGDRPPLSPPELFYQRMLADDPAEALEKAEAFLKEKPLSLYYDEVALKGLALAHADLERGALDPPHLAITRDSVIELVDELDEYGDREAKDDASDVSGQAATSVTPSTASLTVLTPDNVPPNWQIEGCVLCVAGGSKLDEAASAMMAQIIRKHGAPARAEGTESVRFSNLDHLSGESTRVVVASFLAASTTAQMRYIVRRLRRRLPHSRIVVGCWTTDGDLAAIAADVKADAAVATLRDALVYVIRYAREDALNSGGTSQVEKRA